MCGTINVRKFRTLFSFCSHIKGRIHKLLVKIVNIEDPDQSASSEAVRSGSALFVYDFLGKQLVFEILEHLL